MVHARSIDQIVLQCVAVRCSVLQCVAVCCSALKYAAVCVGVPRPCSVLHTAFSKRRRVFAAKVCYSAWHCVTVCCSVLQCVAVCCSVWQCIAYHNMCALAVQAQFSNMSSLPSVHCKMTVELTFEKLYQAPQRLYGRPFSPTQCSWVCCSVLQCVAVCCSVLQCVAVCCRVSQCVAVCCSMLQYVAVYCGTMQYAVVMLQHKTCMKTNFLMSTEIR